MRLPDGRRLYSAPCGIRIFDPREDPPYFSWRNREAGEILFVWFFQLRFPATSALWSLPGLTWPGIEPGFRTGWTANQMPYWPFT